MKNSVIFICTVLFMSMFSCQKMNDNIQGYLDQGEINYIGKPDWAIALSGNNRILLLWIVNSDPRIEQCTIYWNNGLDSTSCQVTPKPLSEIAGLPDTLAIPEALDTIGAKYMTFMLDNMPEDTYIFTMYHTGSLGHRSVRFDVTGQSYGDSYRQTLINRIVKNAVYTSDTGNLDIVWSAAEDGEVGIRLEYFDLNDANNPKTIMVNAKDTTATIPDFDKDKPVYYSTIYKPFMSIDSFQVDKSEISYSVIARSPQNITYMLQNTQKPFALGDMISGDRFYLAANWLVNDVCMVTGNIDNHPSFGGALLGFEAGTGWDCVTDEINNGKFYQTITLDAGDYRFDSYLQDTYGNGSTTDVYMVANIGNDLPDIDNVATATGYCPVPGMTDDYAAPTSMRFSLSETSTVSIGFVGNCPGYTRVLFNRVELWSE